MLVVEKGGLQCLRSELVLGNKYSNQVGLPQQSKLLVKLRLAFGNASRLKRLLLLLKDKQLFRKRYTGRTME